MGSLFGWFDRMVSSRSVDRAKEKRESASTRRVKARTLLLENLEERQLLSVNPLNDGDDFSVLAVSHLANAPTVDLSTIDLQAAPLAAPLATVYDHTFTVGTGALADYADIDLALAAVNALPVGETVLLQLEDDTYSLAATTVSRAGLTFESTFVDGSTISATGLLTISGNGIEFGAGVNLTSTAGLTISNGGAAIFSDGTYSFTTLTNSVGGALTINTGATLSTSANSTVSGTLTVDGGTWNQSGNTSVTLGAAANFNVNTGGTVSIASVTANHFIVPNGATVSVDGGSLTINSSCTTVLNGSFALTNSATLTFAGNAAATFGATANLSVTDSTFSMGVAGTLIITGTMTATNSTITGAALTVTATTGSVTFIDRTQIFSSALSVGANASLTIDNATLSIGASSTSISGNVTLTNNATLIFAGSAAATFTASSSLSLTDSELDMGASGTLTIAGTATLTDSAIKSPGSLTITAGGAITATGTSQLNVAVTYNVNSQTTFDAAVALLAFMNQDSTLRAYAIATAAASGSYTHTGDINNDVTLRSTVNLTIGAGSDLTLSTGTYKFGTVTVSATGALVVNTSTIIATSTVTATGTITTTSTNITGVALIVTATTGVVTFTNGTQTFSGTLTVGANSTLTVDNATFSIGAASATLSGAMVFQNGANVTFGSTATLTATGSLTATNSTVAFTGLLTVTAGGAITATGTSQLNAAVTYNVNSQPTFDAAVALLAFMNQDSTLRAYAIATAAASGSYTYTGDINNDVTLRSTVNLTIGAGSDLTLSTGTYKFGTVTVSATGALTINTSTIIATSTVTATGTITTTDTNIIGGALAITATTGVVTFTNGTQAFSGALTVGANSTLTVDNATFSVALASATLSGAMVFQNGANVSFGSTATITATGSLTATNSTVAFTGALTVAAGGTITATGTSQLNAAVTYNVNDQTTFNAAVALLAFMNLDNPATPRAYGILTAASSGSYTHTGDINNDVTLRSTVNLTIGAGSDLTLSTGTYKFGAVTVSATGALVVNTSTIIATSTVTATGTITTTDTNITGGALAITATTGVVTFTNGTQTFISTLSVGASSSLTLDSASLSIGVSSTAISGNVTLTDNAFLIFSGTAGATFTATSTLSITDSELDMGASGTLAINGTATITDSVINSLGALTVSGTFSLAGTSTASFGAASTLAAAGSINVASTSSLAFTITLTVATASNLNITGFNYISATSGIIFTVSTQADFDNAVAQAALQTAYASATKVQLNISGVDVTVDFVGNEDFTLRRSNVTFNITTTTSVSRSLTAIGTFTIDAAGAVIQRSGTTGLAWIVDAYTFVVTPNAGDAIFTIGAIKASAATDAVVINVAAGNTTGLQNAIDLLNHASTTASTFAITLAGGVYDNFSTAKTINKAGVAVTISATTPAVILGSGLMTIGASAATTHFADVSVTNITFNSPVTWYVKTDTDFGNAIGALGNSTDVAVGRFTITTLTNVASGYSVTYTNDLIISRKNVTLTPNATNTMTINGALTVTADAMTNQTATSFILTAAGLTANSATFEIPDMDGAVAAGLNGVVASINNMGIAAAGTLTVNFNGVFATDTVWASTALNITQPAVIFNAAAGLLDVPLFRSSGTTTTIGSTSTLTLTGIAFYDTALTLNGTLTTDSNLTFSTMTIAGTLTMTAGTLTNTTTGNVSSSISGTLSLTNATWNYSGTVVSTTYYLGVTSTGNVTLNNSQLNITTTTLIVNGNLSATNNSTISGNVVTVNSGGTITMTGSTLTAGGLVTVNNGGMITLNAPTNPQVYALIANLGITVNSGGDIQNGQYVLVTGTVTWNVATDTQFASALAALLNCVVTADTATPRFTITANAAVAYTGNYTISRKNVTLTPNTTNTMTINGALTVDANALANPTTASFILTAAGVTANSAIFEVPDMDGAVAAGLNGVVASINNMGIAAAGTLTVNFNGVFATDTVWASTALNITQPAVIFNAAAGLTAVPLFRSSGTTTTVGSTSIATAFTLNGVALQDTALTVHGSLTTNSDLTFTTMTIGSTTAGQSEGAYLVVTGGTVTATSLAIYGTTTATSFTNSTLTLTGAITVGSTTIASTLNLINTTVTGATTLTVYGTNSTFTNSTVTLSSTVVIGSATVAGGLTLTGSTLTAGGLVTVYGTGVLTLNAPTDPQVYALIANAGITVNSGGDIQNGQYVLVTGTVTWNVATDTQFASALAALTNSTDTARFTITATAAVAYTGNYTISRKNVTFTATTTNTMTFSGKLTVDENALINGNSGTNLDSFLITTANTVKVGSAGYIVTSFDNFLGSTAAIKGAQLARVFTTINSMTADTGTQTVIFKGDSYDLAANAISTSSTYLPTLVLTSDHLTGKTALTTTGAITIYGLFTSNGVSLQGSLLNVYGTMTTNSNLTFTTSTGTSYNQIYGTLNITGGTTTFGHTAYVGGTTGTYPAAVLNVSAAEVNFTAFTVFGTAASFTNSTVTLSGAVTIGSATVAGALTFTDSTLTSSVGLTNNGTLTVTNSKLDFTGTLTLAATSTTTVGTPAGANTYTIGVGALTVASGAVLSGGQYIKVTGLTTLNVANTVDMAQAMTIIQAGTAYASAPAVTVNVIGSAAFPSMQEIARDNVTFNVTSTMVVTIPDTLTISGATVIFKANTGSWTLQDGTIDILTSAAETFTLTGLAALQSSVIVGLNAGGTLTSASATINKYFTIFNTTYGTMPGGMALPNYRMDLFGGTYDFGATAITSFNAANGPRVYLTANNQAILKTTSTTAFTVYDTKLNNINLQAVLTYNATTNETLDHVLDLANFSTSTGQLFTINVNTNNLTIGGFGAADKTLSRNNVNLVINTGVPGGTLNINRDFTISGSSVSLRGVNNASSIDTLKGGKLIITETASPTFGTLYLASIESSLAIYVPAASTATVTSALTLVNTLRPVTSPVGTTAEIFIPAETYNISLSIQRDVTFTATAYNSSSIAKFEGTTRTLAIGAAGVTPTVTFNSIQSIATTGVVNIYGTLHVNGSSQITTTTAAITVYAGGTLNAYNTASISMTTGSLTLSGTLNAQDTASINMTTGNLVVNSGAFLNLSGTATVNSVSTNFTNGQVQINSGGTITGHAYTNYNVDLAFNCLTEADVLYAYNAGQITDATLAADVRHLIINVNASITMIGLTNIQRYNVRFDNSGFDPGRTYTAGDFSWGTLNFAGGFTFRQVVLSSLFADTSSIARSSMTKAKLEMLGITAITATANEGASITAAATLVQNGTGVITVPIGIYSEGFAVTATNKNGITIRGTLDADNMANSTVIRAIGGSYTNITSAGINIENIWFDFVKEADSPSGPNYNTVQYTLQFISVGGVVDNCRFTSNINDSNDGRFTGPVELRAGTVQNSVFIDSGRWHHAIHRGGNQSIEVLNNTFTTNSRNFHTEGSFPAGVTVLIKGNTFKGSGWCANVGATGQNIFYINNNFNDSTWMTYWDNNIVLHGNTINVSPDMFFDWRGTSSLTAPWIDATGNYWVGRTTAAQVYTAQADVSYWALDGTRAANGNLTNLSTEQAGRVMGTVSVMVDINSSTVTNTGVQYGNIMYTVGTNLFRDFGAAYTAVQTTSTLVGTVTGTIKLWSGTVTLPAQSSNFGPGYVISKAVNVIGVGPAESILAGSLGISAANVTLKNFTLSYQGRYVSGESCALLLNNQADHVLIDGLKIINNGTGVYLSHGGDGIITTTGATFSNLVIQNTQILAGTATWRNAMYINPRTVTPNGTFLITGNTIDGAKRAIAVDGAVGGSAANGYINIQNNIIQNVDRGIGLSDYAGDLAKVIISGNEIHMNAVADGYALGFGPSVSLNRGNVDVDTVHANGNRIYGLVRNSYIIGQEDHVFDIEGNYFGADDMEAFDIAEMLFGALDFGHWATNTNGVPNPLAWDYSDVNVHPVLTTPIPGTADGYYYVPTVTARPSEQNFADPTADPLLFDVYYVDVNVVTGNDFYPQFGYVGVIPANTAVLSFLYPQTNYVGDSRFVLSEDGMHLMTTRTVAYAERFPFTVTNPDGEAIACTITLVKSDPISAVGVDLGNYDANKVYAAGEAITSNLTFYGYDADGNKVLADIVSATMTSVGYVFLRNADGVTWTLKTTVARTVSGANMVTFNVVDAETPNVVKVLNGIYYVRAVDPATVKFNGTAIVADTIEITNPSTVDKVGQFTAVSTSGASASVTWSLAGTDANKFTIDPTTGAVTRNTGVNPGTYHVTVVANAASSPANSKSVLTTIIVKAQRAPNPNNPITLVDANGVAVSSMKVYSKGAVVGYVPTFNDVWSIGATATLTGTGAANFTATYDTKIKQWVITAAANLTTTATYNLTLSVYIGGTLLEFDYIQIKVRT